MAASRVMQDRLVSGKDRTGALILSLTDANKKKLFEQFKEREIWGISATMSSLGVIEPVVLKNTMTDFLHLMKQGSSVVGGFDNTRKMLESVLGKDKAGNLLQGVVTDGDGVWEQLSEVNAGMLSKFLQREDPQTTSVILSRLAPGRSAQILKLYEEKFSLDILVRILTGDPIKGAVLAEIQSFLKNEFMEEFKRNADTFDAYKVVAEIMNAFDQKRSDHLLEELEKKAPEAAGKVRALMFTFEDLLRIDGTDMQKVISALDKMQLAIGLKGGSSGVQEHFFANMSERAAKLLKADIEAMGSVRVSEVEKAQREVLAFIKQMQRDGEITIPDASESDATIE